MKLPSAALTVTLVLLPTPIPFWLDTAPPLRAEPLNVVRGTVARATTLKRSRRPCSVDSSQSPSLVASASSFCSADRSRAPPFVTRGCLPSRSRGPTRGRRGRER